MAARAVRCSAMSPENGPRPLRATDGQSFSEEAVQLRYVLTPDDLLDGFLAQGAVGRPHRLRRPLFLMVIGGLTLGIVLFGVLVLGVIGAGLGVALGAWAVAIAGFVVAVYQVPDAVLRRFSPRPRLLYRWAARQLMRGTPMLAEEMRMVVDDVGLRVTATTAESTMAWAQYPVHVETERSLVLMASDRPGAQIVVLPKRALAAGAVEPLRALLAGHSRRLDSSTPPLPVPVEG